MTTRSLSLDIHVDLNEYVINIFIESHMPRAFKSTEKEAIRAALLRHGRRLFGRHGLRRVTIQELTQAADIAQGSFYNFYESKEDLFFEILEAEEKELFDRLVGKLRPRPVGRKRLKEILLSGFEQYRTHPFLGSLLASGEYEQLRRGISAPRFRQHLERESALVVEVMESLRSDDGSGSMDPKLFAGLLQAIFLLLVHREEFEAEVLPRMIDLLVGLVADTATRAP
jgi:AcrR family transcriptional regulator